MECNLEVKMQSMGLNEKLEMIDKIWESNYIKEDDFTTLEYLAQDAEEEIRARVAEVLVISNSLKAEQILIRLLTDNDELVRINACDSLSNSESLEVIGILKERILKDKSSLVKGYAASSIADIASCKNHNIKELTVFFKHLLGREKVDWVKVHFYKVLYLFGHKMYLNKLLNGLSHRLYRNRSAVVSILSELISKENYETIKLALIEQLNKEKTVAVKSKIEDVLQDIDRQKIYQ